MFLIWLYNMYNGYIQLEDNVNVNEHEENTGGKSPNAISIGVQTDVNIYGYTSFNSDGIDDLVNTDDVDDLTNSFFKHLDFANQSYYNHFKDAIKYSFISLRASYYFMCHAFWPDIYTRKGSDTIHELSGTIYEKYIKRMQEIRSERG